ncbi:MAG: hypothetical protein OXH69_13125 [Acidobacteria bacterium]|nr:hypothetical protein [Acidobacteriota bacterium]
MLVEDHGRVPPERGLALETDALHALARATPRSAAGAERLLIWESAWPAVILPRRGEPARWVRAPARAARGVPLLERVSGGGAVVVGPGCLTFALVLSLEARPRLADVAHSYDWLLAREAGVLTREAGGPGCGGIAARSTDLALQDRKFAGHAQRRVRGGLLHHGVLLYDFDIDLIDCLLAEPSRAPAWRRGRSHREFLTNARLPRSAVLRGLRRLPAALGR